MEAIFTEAVRQHAAVRPNALAFSFLDDSGVATAELTYAGLDRAAREIAAGLQQSGDPRGERVLIMHPTGPDFVCALFGALYAGAAAMPLALPRSTAMLRALGPILQGGQPRFGLLTPAMAEKLAVAGLLPQERGTFEVIATQNATSGPEKWRAPDIDSKSLALVQYTSGSTGVPRGAMAAHGNLCHNAQMMGEAFGNGASSVFVCWLPLFHDMGLIGNVLQSAWLGSHCVLFSPTSFIRRPSRWLQAISRYRADFSGAPDFAYELCTRKIRAGECRDIDLSAWRVAFTGAEPVREETLLSFSRRFATNGFSFHSFYPCYGLAEATVFVSGGSWSEEPNRIRVSVAALARDRVEPASEAEPAKTFVSCGRSWCEQEIVIVDLEGTGALPEDRIGEIWIAGRSVTSGYFRDPRASAEIFSGQLGGRSDAFLKTGDLGFIHQGELYIAGRRKDMIIIHGRNYYPQDIEQAVESCHPALRPGETICFSIEEGSVERLVIVQEVRAPEADWPPIAAAVRAAVFERHDLRVTRIVLAGPGAVEKTSSGKPRRRDCRARLLSGELRVLFESHIPPQEDGLPWSHNEDLSAEPLAIADRLRQWVASELRLSCEAIDVDRSMLELGMDSLAATSLRRRLEEELGVSLTIEQLLTVNLRDLEVAAASGLAVRSQPVARTTQPQALCGIEKPHGMSAFQRQVWFHEQLSPGHHHIPFGILVEGPLDAVLLRAAIDRVVSKHDALRTFFINTASGPEGHVANQVTLELPFEDLGGSDPAAQTLLVAELARTIATPAFDLTRAPLLRLRLIRLEDNRHLLIVVVHHLVADGWSTGLIARDLVQLYGRSGSTLPQYLTPALQNDPVSVRQVEQSRAYWRERLRDAQWFIDLPRVRPRSGTLGPQAPIRCVRDLPSSTRSRVEELARREGVTPFVVLLGAFQCLLHYYSGQTDLSVGTVVARRAAAASRDVVGAMVNTVVLRTDSARDPAFRECLRRLQRVVSEALEHCDTCLDEVVRELPGIWHGQVPFQVMFVYHSFPSGPFLGDGLKCSLVDLDIPSVPFDLTLELRPLDTGFSLAIDADPLQFDPPAISAIMTQYCCVLEAALTGSERRISQLSPWGQCDSVSRGSAVVTPEVSAAEPFVPVQRAFSVMARGAPDAPAILGEESWSYARLDRVSDSIADIVAMYGGGPEERIGIHIDRAALRLATVLGVLKAGAAYVPLDATLPAARLQWMVERSRARLVLSTSHVDWCPPERLHLVGEPFPEVSSGGRLGIVEVLPENIAYVIFTSGSTGEPSGVAVSHAALAQQCVAIAARYGLRSSDRVLQFASIGFDVSVEEMFPTWSQGGAVVTVEDRAPQAVHRLVERCGITVLNLPSRYWEWWGDCCTSALGTVRKLIVGSETVSAAALADFRRRFPHIECFHAYGLTESTITSLVHRVSDSDAGPRLPLGEPLGAGRIHVMDPQMRPVGPGGAGELCIAGSALARGYLDRPDRTAERFIPDPFGGRGARLLRTGDRVRCRWDGGVEYLGRLDGQLKLQGHRISPEEVEAALRRAGAREAAVVARGERLWAYIECDQSSVLEVRRAAAAELPRYSLPTAWVEVDAWSRTSGGKIDRLQLTEAPPILQGEGSEPRGPVESALSVLFGELLGLERVYRETDFFLAGGYSLLAMRLLDRITQDFAVRLPLTALFQTPTVWELAERIGRHEARKDPMVAVAPSGPDMNDSTMALSSPQRRLWFLERLQPGTSQYNMPLGIVVKGPLVEERLRRAFDELIERHESLRVVVEAGMARPGPRASLGVQWVGSWEAAEQRALELARTPFVIQEGPLIRGEILKVGPSERLIVIVVHHLVCDGRSLQIMLAELGDHYRDGRLPPPRGQPYRDYVRHEAGWDSSSGLHYWRQKLAGCIPTWLPYDGSENNSRAEHLLAELPVTRGELVALSRRAGVTTHMTLLGIMQVLLHRISGNSDIRIAIPVANRSEEVLQDTVGCFVNTVILRTLVNPRMPFVEHLREVKRVALEAYEHQGTPFDDVVTALRLSRGPGLAPIELMLLVEEENLGADFGPECLTEVKELDSGAAKFDLTLTIRLRARSVEAEVEYDTGRFQKDTIADLLCCLQELSQSIVRAPEERNHGLCIMSRDMESQILGWEHGGATRHPCMLQDFVRAQASLTPNAIAVRCGARRLTYRQLIERSNQVAHGLVRRGIGPQALVGLRMSRTEDLVVAMLGVLQAGGIYVPIDPEYPQERQSYIESDSGVRFTLSGLGEFLLEPVSGIERVPNPDHVAYIIYTSGSEGRPKGVEITHRGASALIHWARETYTAEQMRRVVACTSVCFDLSAFEVYAPLSVGGTVEIVENALAIPEAEDASLINTVPSAMSRILDRLPPGVLTVNLAGEALPRSLVDALYERGVRDVWNLYGPSEDTTYSTGLRVPRDQRLMPGIGHPLPGRTARVLDENLERVPRCARGELFLAGAGLARGYVNQPAKSADRFVPDPFAADGTRLYRTGDWVRYRADGTLEFLGRRDAQVKVRGYRIEPGEVEDALRRAGALEAVVMAAAERLIAYVEPGEHALTEIRTSVNSTLPRYLVPAVWISMDKWPRTASGKIDRKALPAAMAAEAETTVPEGDTEVAVAAIFREVLGLQEVGRETNFFDAGGHSLLAMQVIDRIGRVCGVQLPVREVFEAPVVWELAARVEGARGSRTHRQSDSRTQSDAPSEGGRTEAPATSAQRRLWFLEQMSPGTSNHHVPIRLDVTGPLDVAVLTGAFEAILTRHAGLRSEFLDVDGAPFQRVVPALDLPITVHAQEDEGILDRFIAQEVERPFQLAKAPLFRISVIRTGEHAFTLLLVMHHIVCDEWSLGVLLREFAELYLSIRAGRQSALPPLPLQLVEHALVEASAEAMASLDNDRRYWSERLRGVTPLKLPAPARPAGGSSPATWVSFRMERTIADAVQRLAREASCTHAMVLLATFAALLHQGTRVDDITIGMPVANRHPDTEPLIGFFVNQLAIRIDLSGRPSFAGLLRRVRTAALDAYSHQRLSFEEIVAVASKGARSSMPLINTQLDVHNAPFGPLQIGDLKLTPRTVSRSTVQFDIQLSIEEVAEGLHGFLGFNPDKVDGVWGRSLADDFGSFLERAAAAPSRWIGDLTEGLAVPAVAAREDDFQFRE